MTRAYYLTGCLALWACEGATGDCVAPATTPGPEGRGASAFDGGAVLWVGAHPDDETTAAPLLATWCGVSGARCTFLVLTRGEGGQCGLAEGCVPDLATVRTHEMEGSARLFDAGLVQETLPNAAGAVDEAVSKWVAAAGSEEAVVERISRVLVEGAFDTLVTFDPRHGVTCHGEHRVAGAAALRAADRAGLPRGRVLLLGSAMYLREARPGLRCLLGFSAAVPDDGALWTLPPSVDGWARAVAVMRTHASQFDADTLAAAELAPDTLRSTWYLWASDVIEDDPRYAALCR